MPVWFNKLFKGGEKAPTPAPGPAAPEHSAALSPVAAPTAPAKPAPVRPTFLMGEDEDDTPSTARRVIDAPLKTEEEAPASPSDIRIKARAERDGQTFVFMVDRPVLHGFSAWFPVPAAAVESPLAQAVFSVPGVDAVLIHDMNITVTREPFQQTDWVPWAKEIGARIREHLKGDRPVVTPEYVRRMPSEEQIRERLQMVLDTEINPGIASHSGEISLEHVEGNTVYIRMMGGCQGCAASTVTLRQGVHQAFREAVPQVGAILDQTDHAAGKNPYYRQLPAGMGTDA